MCAPVVLAAVAAVGVIANYAQQLQSSSRQRGAFNDSRARAESRFALEAAGLRRRQSEERLAAGREIQAIMADSLARRSTLFAAAAEAGVDGASLRGLVQDFTGTELNRIFGVEQNLQARDLAIESQLQLGHLQLESGVQQSFAQLDPRPTLLSPILGLGLAVGRAQVGAPEGTFLGIGEGPDIIGGQGVPVVNFSY